MNTIFRLDHRIIKVILSLFCLLCLNSVAYCESGENMVKIISEHISVRAEQEFWKNWISEKSDSTCPLQPFVLSYNQAGIDQFENKIKKIGNTDSAILFTQINIDNGVYYFYYLAWNRGNKLMHSLEWASPNSKIVEKKIAAKFNIINSLDKLSSHSVLVDIEDRSKLDGDSMYLSLWHKGGYSRFASYNPKFNKKKQTQSELPFLFINELLNKHKKK